MYKMTVEFKSVKTGEPVQRSIESDNPREIINWFNNHFHAVDKRTLRKDFYFKIIKVDNELMKWIKVPKKLRSVIF